MSTMLFKRVVVMEGDVTERHFHEFVATHAKGQCLEWIGVPAVPVKLSDVLPIGENEVLFYANDGDAFGIGGNSKETMRAVYLACGFGEDSVVQPFRNRIKRNGDIDFDGVVECGAVVECELDAWACPTDRTMTTAHLVDRFGGEQSEFFANLHEFALLAPVQLCRKQSRKRRKHTSSVADIVADNPLNFQQPYRSGVATLRRPEPPKCTRLDLAHAQLLGEGCLTWPAAERRLDRYGFVKLSREPVEGSDLVELSLGGAVGEHGMLVAEVMEVRQSPHIGDRFRRIFHETPEVGELVVLGNGLCTAEEGNTAVGLQPDDDREIDWLHPKSLFRCHIQTVRLHFVPTARDA